MKQPYESVIEYADLFVHFKAEMRDPNWYEAPNQENVEWVILRVYVPRLARSLSLNEIDEFERKEEEGLNKAIINDCLRAKEKADEDFALRNV